MHGKMYPMAFEAIEPTKLKTDSTSYTPIAIPITIANKTSE